MKDKYLAMHDDFILAKYDFNLETSKLLFACLYKANSEYIKPIINQKSHIYQLDFEEIKSYCGIDYDLENKPKVIDRITRDLTSKIVQFTTSRGSWKTVGIIKSFDIIASKQLVEVEIDNDLKPYLVEEFKRFTKLGFKHLGLCKSKYSFRLYEILLMKSKNIPEEKKYIKLSVEEIRSILQFPKSQGYNAFKERVLEKSKEEYNATDIENLKEREEKKLFKSFEYREVVTRQRGKGRNPVTDIVFEFELLDETKLLMMSKTEKVEKELDNEDWILIELRILIDKNKTRNQFFTSMDIHEFHKMVILSIESAKHSCEYYEVIPQQIIRNRLIMAFDSFKTNSGFEKYLHNGFVKGIQSIKK